MKKSIEQLAIKFAPLNNYSLSTITGGTGGPPLTNAELQRLFNYNAFNTVDSNGNTVNGFNTQEGMQFTALVQMMEQTNFGYGMLSAMLSSNEPTINLSSTSPNGANAIGAYMPATNSLYLNPNYFQLTIPAGGYDQGQLLDTVAHELYHSFQNNILGILSPLGDTDPNASVKIELDAYLAGAEVLHQYDLIHGSSFYQSVYLDNHAGDSFVSNNGGLFWTGVSNPLYPYYDPHNTFARNFDSAVTAGTTTFSLATYNELIADFKASFFDPAINNFGVGKPYINMNANPVTDLNDISQVQINRLLFYSPTTISIPIVPTPNGTVYNPTDITNFIQDAINFYYYGEVNLGRSFNTASSIATTWTYNSFLGVFQNTQGDTMGILQIPSNIMGLLVNLASTAPMGVSQQQLVDIKGAIQDSLKPTNFRFEAPIGVLSPPVFLPPPTTYTYIYGSFGSYVGSISNGPDYHPGNFYYDPVTGNYTNIEAYSTTDYSNYYWYDTRTGLPTDAGNPNAVFAPSDNPPNPIDYQNYNEDSDNNYQDGYNDDWQYYNPFEPGTSEYDDWEIQNSYTH